MVRTAKELGCSVFELKARHDVGYWIAAANAYSEYEQWLQEKQQKRR